MVNLRGMTWDHLCGFDPMVATTAAYAQSYPGVNITWKKRSFQSFVDRPISEMAQNFDLTVIDYPYLSEVAKARTGQGGLVQTSLLEALLDF